MEPVLPRRCETCLHHRSGPTASTGRCGHPERQPLPNHLAPYVRARELGCYQGWGTDHWEAGPQDNIRSIEAMAAHSLIADLGENSLSFNDYEGPSAEDTILVRRGGRAALALGERRSSVYGE